MKAFRDGEVVREFVGALPPAAVAQFLDELTGPTATEQLVAELQASGELPEVVEALEQDEHEQRTRAAARGDQRRRGRVARTSDHPDRRPVRRARPRAPAHDALPAATRRQPLLMAMTTETTDRAAEGVPLPGLGRVARRAARRRPRRGQAADRDHPAARLPRHRPLRPGAPRTSSSPPRPRVSPSPSPASPPAPGSPTRSLTRRRRRRRRQARRRPLRLHAPARSGSRSRPTRPTSRRRAGSPSRPSRPASSPPRSTCPSRP